MGMLFDRRVVRDNGVTIELGRIVVDLDTLHDAVLAMREVDPRAGYFLGEGPSAEGITTDAVRKLSDYDLTRLRIQGQGSGISLYLPGGEVMYQEEHRDTARRVANILATGSRRRVIITDVVRFLPSALLIVAVIALGVWAAVDQDPPLSVAVLTGVALLLILVAAVPTVTGWLRRRPMLIRLSRRAYQNRVISLTTVPRQEARLAREADRLRWVELTLTAVGSAAITLVAAWLSTR